MPRIHFIQQWFNLSNPAMEGALLREFVGLDVGKDKLLDESAILRFRHLLEQHYRSRQILATVDATPVAKGLFLKSGTMVVVTLIAAPSLIKNSRGERATEMFQTKNENQWLRDEGSPQSPDNQRKPPASEITHINSRACGYYTSPLADIQYLNYPSLPPQISQNEIIGIQPLEHI